MLARGTLAQRTALQKAMATWANYANVKFKQVYSGDCEARWAFVPGGSWSYLGRQCLRIPATEPTGNIGWPDDPGRDLHELGHLLGLLHGHQVDPISWIPEACYAYYGGPPNDWSRREVDEQVLFRYASSQVLAGPPDPRSIMRYPVPAELVSDPRDANGWNQALTAGDIAMIRQLFPGRK